MRKYIFISMLALLAGLAFFNGKSERDLYASQTLQYTWTLDTLTDAANDTLVLPWVLQSRFTQGWQITRTNISGTTNISAILQASVAYSDTKDPVWVTVATSSGTGATNELLTLAESYGQRYRIIMDGTGTQSTSYRISFLGKRQPN